MKRLTTCAALLLAATLGINAQKPMKAPKGGKAISDELIGIFFEDISSSADGGLYAELVENGSFEYSPAERDGWGAVRHGNRYVLVTHLARWTSVRTMVSIPTIQLTCV